MIRETQKCDLHGPPILGGLHHERCRDRDFPLVAPDLLFNAISGNPACGALIGASLVLAVQTAALHQQTVAGIQAIDVLLRQELMPSENLGDHLQSGQR